MKTICKMLPAASAAALLTMTVAQAHHSFAMFDREQEIVKTGTVVRWAFNNPHSWLYLNVKNDDGSETSVELRRLGAAVVDSTRHHGRHLRARRYGHVHVLPAARRPSRRRHRLGEARGWPIHQPRRRRLRRQRAERQPLEGLAREGLHVESRRRESAVAAPNTRAGAARPARSLA